VYVVRLVKFSYFYVGVMGPCCYLLIR